MESITERLARLTLDNKQRRLTEAADLRLGYALCGSILLDLMLAGALQAHEDGTCAPNPKAKLRLPYLQEAFAALPSYSVTEQQALLRTLYAIMPRLKELVLDSMVQRGVLREDTAKIKWAFALKAYVLKVEYAGYRLQSLHALKRGTIPLYDCWVLQLAAASGLLWAEEGEGKKDLQSALRRLRELGGMTGQLHQLTGLMRDELPDVIAQSHKLPRLGKKSAHPTTWEWRGFWLDKGATLIQASEMYKQSLENISFSEIMDYYVVIEGVAANVKCRKNALEIKTPIDSREGYTAFSPKQVHRFPFMLSALADVISPLANENTSIKNAHELCDALLAKGIGAALVEVKKKRFQVKLQSQVKVEFCTLQFAGRKYLSACVEGPDYAITHAHSHNFRIGQVMEMGYVEFLKHCQMEQAL